MKYKDEYTLTFYWNVLATQFPVEPDPKVIRELRASFVSGAIAMFKIVDKLTEDEALTNDEINMVRTGLWHELNNFMGDDIDGKGRAGQP